MDETVSEDVETVIDVDALAEQERDFETLREQVQAQEEQIDKLQGLLADLSARVADGGGMGVCPECNGPVTKVRRWFASNTIECRRCGERLHEY